ncbi:MAG: FecR family protein [Bacteroidales bacterium]|nr:FecR family protein [Bacteroidales bacterium]
MNRKIIMKNINTNIDIDELIAGYCSNELSVNEIGHLRDWLNLSPDNKKYFQQRLQIWFFATVTNDKVRFDKEKAFELFLTRKAASLQKQVFTEKRLPLIVFRRIVAAIAILLIFAGAGYWLGAGRVKDLIAEDVVMEVPFGSRSKMYLPDGTLVWLNAGSTLSYAQNFGVNNRTVNLKGEGYFEVVHQKKKPFYVISDDLKIHVLGTKFNLRNYLEEDEARITLLEGSVKVNCNSVSQQEFYLKPHEQIIYDRETAIARTTLTNALNSLEWTNGYLFFDKEKLPNIARELERSYNVKIKIADESLKTFRFYGDFSRTEQTIQEVLEVLASTKRLSYEINGKEIILKKK